jgi:transposase
VQQRRVSAAGHPVRGWIRDGKGRLVPLESAPHVGGFAPPGVDKTRRWLAQSAVARDELADITVLTGEIDALDKRIAVRVRAQARALLTILGCAELTAAKVVGETAGVSRFRSEAAFACYAGVAPLPRSSGGTRVRVRAARSGNRQLNVALFRIAFTQIRHPGAGQVYYQKRRAAGDAHAEALRRLQRRVVRHVFGCLRADCADWPATSLTPRSFSELELINAQWSDALALLGS